MDTIVSGMRPTGGQLHLGHLHGALKNWVRLQDQYHCYFFAADWHVLTTDYASPQNIEQNTLKIAMDWLSVGLDPERCVIFRQSRIKEHAELHLLLSMITPVPWLERNPTYKEQIRELVGRDLSTYGFLGYPVLQAADIVMYKANKVPVGLDQAPHVELTRALDPARVKRSDPGEPEKCPAFQLHKIYCTPEEIEYVSEGCRTAGIGCLECKKVMIKHVVEELAPIQQKRAALEKRPGEVEEVLAAGNRTAQQKASETMAEVRETLGL